MSVSEGGREGGRDEGREGGMDGEGGREGKCSHVNVIEECCIQYLSSSITAVTTYLQKQEAEIIEKKHFYFEDPG